MQDHDWTGLAGRLLVDQGEKVAAQGFPSWFEVFDPGRDFRPAAEDAGTLGWTASPDCLAVAMVATAKLHVRPGPCERPPGLNPGITPGAHLACVVARDGAVGWEVTVPGTEMPPGPPQEGRMLDLLRRALGLATPPPDQSAKPLQALFWLGAILAHGPVLDARMTWTQVVQLHPMVLISRHQPVPPDVGDLISAGGMELSWEKLRLATVENSWADAVVDSTEAAWMDEGMFSRWVLSELPPAEPLLEEVRPFLTPSAGRRLTHSIRAAYSPLPEPSR